MIYKTYHINLDLAFTVFKKKSYIIIKWDELSTKQNILQV